MKRLSSRERILAIICLVLLLAAGMLEMVVKPLRAALADTTEALIARKIAIDEAKAEALNMYYLESENLRLQERLEPLVISGEAIPIMIRKAEKAAKEADIEQIEIRPLGDEESQGLLAHRMQLELSASFPELKDFIYYLEAGKEAFWVERLDINSDRSNSDTVSATILITAYSLLEGGAK